MPKKKIKKEDIRDPEHYFARWLRQEKKHFETNEYEQRKKETSLEALEMTDRDVSFFCSVNKNGELFAHVEGIFPEFEWMEEVHDFNLYQALVELPYDEKYLLTLRIDLELSHREIAEQMGVSENAAKLRFSRLLKKIEKIYWKMTRK